MSVEQAFFPRGKTAGVYPTLTTRNDEAYVEFIDDARKILIHAQQAPIGAYSQELIKEAGLSEDTTQENGALRLDLEATCGMIAKDAS